MYDPTTHSRSIPDYGGQSGGAAVRRLWLVTAVCGAVPLTHCGPHRSQLLLPRHVLDGRYVVCSCVRGSVFCRVRSVLIYPLFGCGVCYVLCCVVLCCAVLCCVVLCCVVLCGVVLSTGFFVQVDSLPVWARWVYPVNYGHQAFKLMAVSQFAGHFSFPRPSISLSLYLYFYISRSLPISLLLYYLFIDLFMN
jgi:hypothetical protein